MVTANELNPDLTSTTIEALQIIAETMVPKKLNAKSSLNVLPEIKLVLVLQKEL